VCGVAGILDLDGRLGPGRLRELAGAMADALAHRGPDDRGVWVAPDGRCALSQRRLSILDVSEHGHQPMVDPTGRRAITYNGELYDFRELRERLVTQGHRFTSRGDTEVVLHLLADQHVDRLAALAGMFALGHYDAGTGRLLLARDPFGKKPLLVARGPGWLAFASELRALDALPDLDRTVTRDALGSYLLLQYVHGARTIWRGVRRVPPGCYLLADRDGRARSGRYFAFDAGAAQPDVTLAPDYAGRLEQLETLVDRAVERRLVSDVPLGAFLSGGVDSALVVATMHKLGTTPRTYSVGFADSPDSEHAQARAIAERLGCEHHEVLVEPDAIELAPRIAARLDEPNGDSSCLPTEMLSEFTRRHVTVALSGDGGDEMFGGYGRYLDVVSESRDPPDGWTASRAYLGPRWTIFERERIGALLGGVPARVDALLARWGDLLERDDRPLLHRMRNVDVESYLPGSVLAKVDRMSMQHALEVRCPLLDVDVAAFAAALPQDDLLDEVRGDGPRRVAGKRILKDLLARHVPRAWVDRPKQGFGLPAGFWDAEGLRDFAHEVLAAPDTRLRDHLDRRALDDWLASQQDPARFSIYRLWPMLVLELWLRGPRAGAA